MKTETALAEAKKLLKKGETLADAGKYLEALEILESLPPIFEEVEDWESYAYCLNEIGKVYYYPKQNFPLPRAAQLAKAKEIFQQALSVGREKLGKTHFFVAETQHFLGYVYFRLGEYHFAFKHQQAVWDSQIAILGVEHPLLYKVYKQLMQNYEHSYHHQPNKIWTYYQNWRTIFEAEPEKYAIYLVELYYYLGHFFYYTHPRRAFTFLQKSLDLNLSLFQKDSFQTPKIYHGLAIYYYQQGESELAISYFQKNIALISRPPSNDTANLPLVYSNLANAYSRSGAVEQSLFFYHKAIDLGIDIWGEEGKGLIGIYQSTASAYIAIQDWTNSLYYNQKAYQLYQSRQQSYLRELLQICLNFGSIYIRLQHPQQAQTYLKQALQTMLEAYGKQHSHTIFCNSHLHLYYMLQKNNTLALSHLQEALNGHFEQTNAKRQPYHFPNIDKALLLSNIFITLRYHTHFFRLHYQQKTYQLLDLSTAIFTAQLTDNTLSTLRRTRQIQGSRLSMSHLANNLYKYGLIALHLATQIVDNQADDFVQATEKLAQINAESYPKDSFNYCYTLSDCYNIAFSFSEKSKGMALLDKLKDKEAKLGADIPKALLDKETDLQADLLYYEREIKQGEAKLRTMEAGKEKDEQDEYLTSLQAKHFDCYEELKPVMEQLTNECPDYHRLKYKEDTASIAQLQDALTEQQAIISYFVATPTKSQIPIAHDETPIFIFCITQHSFEFYRIEKPDDFNKRVKNLLKTINRMRYKKYVQAAHDLYQILIAPIVEQLNNQHIEDLIIIPHDNLSGVPFEALLTDAAEDLSVGSYSELPYLIQQYNISYHYSATLFYQSVLKEKEPKGEPASGFVGFAPIYTEQAHAPSTDSSVEMSAEQQAEMAKMVEDGIIPVAKSEQDLIIADFDSLANPMALRGATRDIEIDGEKYAALLFSEEEVKGIEELLTEKGIEVEIFLHEQATMKRFKEAVKGKKYIHIAAHGYDHIVQKDLTGIVFSPDENTKKQSDTILFLADAYALQLDADLVVLSSCKSGIGAVAEGEGMIAMNRGFLYAGAKNVMYTLFKIYDQASSELTQHFFDQAINQQKSYSKALQLAKREMIAQANYTPKHWAGFVLIGK